MKRNFKKDRKTIAKERIVKLFELAKESKDLALSKRYITLARKLSTKYNVSIPRQYKRLFCKNCGCFFLPGKTCRVRLKGHNIVYSCLNCKHISRYRHK